MTNALSRLLEISPAPTEPRRKDWDDYLYVLEPGCPNENYDLIEWTRNQAEGLEDL
ncbi:hypothetical protein O1L60_18535 [Streptomyces diastatochromogenes]|nr:hypothetical protein [Streptomyces diastatochromogenes]